MEKDHTVTVRNLTSEDLAVFHVELCEVNWGVCVDGEPVACFQAEDDGDGWLRVHANVLRHRLHPRLTYAYAKTFSDQLLAYGAVGLICEIALRNRAAVWIARQAGYAEVSRNDEFITLVRYGQTQTETNADSIQSDEHVYRMETIEYA